MPNRSNALPVHLCVGLSWDGDGDQRPLTRPHELVRLQQTRPRPDRCPPIFPPLPPPLPGRLRRALSALPSCLPLPPRAFPHRSGPRRKNARAQQATNDSDYLLLASDDVSVFFDNSLATKTSLASVSPGESFQAFLGTDPAVKVNVKRPQRRLKDASKRRE